MKNLTYMQMIFFGIRFGKQTFFSNLMMFLTNFDQKWIICEKKKKIYKKCEKLNQSLQIFSKNRKKIREKTK